MAAVVTPPLVALKTILVATDFSPCSEKALLYAAALARQAKGKIIATHIIPFEPLLAVPMDRGPEPAVPVAKNPQFRIKQAISVPETSGIECETLLRQGDFWPALEQTIEQHEVDLLIVGTHGREGLKKLVLGSLAEEVFRRAACPVITVGPHVGPECLEDGRLRRVLFATDLSTASLHALPYVTTLAQQHGAALTFLHVLASAIEYAEFGTTAYVQREVEETRSELERLVPPGAHADVVVEVGLPAETIVRVAEAQKASLIALGLHSQSVFAATHLPWTTAHHVVCNAHCPVLTVR
jgi:nucleotide-binding universal stress UspA family protein